MDEYDSFLTALEESLASVTLNADWPELPANTVSPWQRSPFLCKVVECGGGDNMSDGGERDSLVRPSSLTTNIASCSSDLSHSESWAYSSDASDDTLSGSLPPSSLVDDYPICARDRECTDDWRNSTFTVDECKYERHNSSCTNERCNGDGTSWMSSDCSTLTPSECTCQPSEQDTQLSTKCSEHFVSSASCAFDASKCFRDEANFDSVQMPPTDTAAAILSPGPASGVNGGSGSDSDVYKSALVRSGSSLTASLRSAGDDDEVNGDCVNGGAGDSLVTSLTSVTSSVAGLTPADLRACLRQAGVDAGPINQFTERVYRRRLTAVRRRGNILAPPTTQIVGGASELAPPAVSDVIEWSQAELAALVSLETNYFEHYRSKATTTTATGAAEGGARCCFNYLLLDPRLTPHVHRHRADGRALAAFAAAVFYVGKGQQQRSYCHLQEALAQRGPCHSDSGSDKVRRITDIWRAGLGVVPVHVFLHRSAREALARESLLIETLQLQRLTNVKRGHHLDVRGSAGGRAMTSGQRRRLGVFLLYKALCQFQLDGEVQLLPTHVPARWRPGANV